MYQNYLKNRVMFFIILGDIIKIRVNNVMVVNFNDYGFSNYSVIQY